MDAPEDITTPERAVAWLLRAVGEEPTGDQLADRTSAAHATKLIRRLNSVAGGLALDALNEHLTWRQIEDETGIKVRTARRWGDSPPE